VPGTAQKHPVVPSYHWAVPGTPSPKLDCTLLPSVHTLHLCLDRAATFIALQAAMEDHNGQREKDRGDQQHLP